MGIQKSIRISGIRKPINRQEKSKEEGKRKEAGKEAGLERNRTRSGTCSLFKGGACCPRAGRWLVVEEGAGAC